MTLRTLVPEVVLFPFMVNSAETSGLSCVKACGKCPGLTFASVWSFLCEPVAVAVPWRIKFHGSRRGTASRQRSYPCHAAFSPMQNEEIRRDVLSGLRDSPKQIPSKWLYAGRGAELFAQAVQQPEYYIAKAERRLLRRYASFLAKLSNASTFVDLGCSAINSGDAFLEAFDRLRWYVAVDSNAGELKRSLSTVNTMKRTGLEADLLTPIVLDGPRPYLVALLGQTYGNFDRSQGHVLLTNIASLTNIGELLLLGIDCTTDRGSIERAYNDEAGATERFAREILTTINRELSGTIDPAGFEYRARLARSRLTVGLLASRSQDFVVSGEVFSVRRDEEILLALSRRGSVVEFVSELEEAGFTLCNSLDDHQSGYKILIASRGRLGF